MESHGRIIDYARISVTELCNLRCRYCMPECGVEKVPHCRILSLEQMLLIAKALVKLGIKKIRVTGGEPLVRKNIGFLLAELGKLNLEMLSLTTNGTLIPEHIEEIKEAGIKTINVSLDSLNKERYAFITGKDCLERAIAGIDIAISYGLKVKLNAVLMKDFNDTELLTFLEFSHTRGIDFRFIELMPFEGNTDFYNRYALSSEELLKRYALVTDCHELHGTERLYSYKELGFGIITPLSHRFCDSCNRIRITAKGEMLPCLHHSEKLDLLPFLEDEAQLASAILQGIESKPLSHNIENGILQHKNMNNIGG